MFKWIAFTMLAGVVVVLGIAGYAYFAVTAGQPPSLEKAPYALQAYYDDENGEKIPTRIYYAESIEIEEGFAVLMNYWTYDGKGYNKHEGMREIPPPYSIVRRLQ